jgi:F0F1-type ATP synthase epsilon subunit
MNEELISVKIQNLEEIVFEGEVKGISSVNEQGLFDVISLHTNFITLIKEKIILHKNGGDQEIKVDSGVLKVYENKIYVFLGI